MGSNCSTARDHNFGEDILPTKTNHERAIKGDQIIYNLRRIPKAQDYLTRKAILSSLFDLYKIYVLSSRRFSDISYIMEPKTFFIAVAETLHDRSVILADINEEILTKIVDTLSQTVRRSDDDTEIDIYELLRLNYGLLAQEEELFGLTVSNQVRYNYPKENLYGLFPNQLARNIELSIGSDQENEKFLITKEELYNLLSKTIIDSRSFDSPRFFDVVKSHRLVDTDGLSPNSSSEGLMDEMRR